MKNIIKKAFLSSLGIVQLTYDKAERLAKDLVDRGIFPRTAQEKFIDALIYKNEKNTTSLYKKAKETIEELSSRGSYLIDVTKVKRSDSEAEIVEMVKKTIASAISKSKSLKKGARSRRKSLEEIIDIEVEKTFKELNIPTRENLEEIKAKLDQLIEELEKKKVS